MTDRVVTPEEDSPTRPKLPPRWFIRGAWVAHRSIYRLTGGRRGLSHPTQGASFGHLRLRTIGRRSGAERIAILGYVEDGPNYVTLAMNGWADADPAWWLNLQARPEAIVELKGGATQAVRARAAEGAERHRLWAALRGYTGYGDFEAFTYHRAGKTAVVVLEPRGD